MEQIPLYLSISFVLLTLVAVALFVKAANYNKRTLIVLLAWLALQSLLALSGFYKVTNTLPPRIMAALLPPVVCITILFLTAGGRAYICGLNIKTLTLLHIVRIPVELILLGLYYHHFIPKVMTFEGRNFDVLSGLSAILVYFFCFYRHKFRRRLLLVWNVVCLVLLLNIVVIAILSAPFPFQHFGFEQPNRAILYFPFNLLPACVVPLVLFAHLAAIRQLFSTNFHE